MGKDGCDVVERGRGEVRPTRERERQLIFDFFTEGELGLDRLRSGIAVGADCRGTMHCNAHTHLSQDIANGLCGDPRLHTGA